MDCNIISVLLLSCFEVFLLFVYRLCSCKRVFLWTFVFSQWTDRWGNEVRPSGNSSFTRINLPWGLDVLPSRSRTRGPGLRVPGGPRLLGDAAAAIWSHIHMQRAPAAAALPWRLTLEHHMTLIPTTSQIKLYLYSKTDINQQMLSGPTERTLVKEEEFEFHL